MGSHDGRILQMDAVKLRMRMEKRRDTKPKSLGEVFKPLATAQFTPVPAEYSREMPMKARSVRFRGRTLVVGRSAFVFDKEGVCEHKPVGNSVADFNTLLTYHGVEEVVPVVETASTIGPDDPTVPFADVPKVGEPAPAAPPAAVPADDSGIVRDPVPVPEFDDESTDETSMDAAGDQPAQPLSKSGRRRRVAQKLEE